MTTVVILSSFCQGCVLVVVFNLWLVWYFTGVLSEWLAMATFLSFENSFLRDVSNLVRRCTEILITLSLVAIVIRS